MRTKAHRPQLMPHLVELAAGGDLQRGRGGRVADAHQARHDALHPAAVEAAVRVLETEVDACQGAGRHFSYP